MLAVILKYLLSVFRIHAAVGMVICNPSFAVRERRPAIPRT
jgi:hypothetical protein